MKTIDIDESAELTIRCKQSRSFDLTVNLNRDLTGKTYKLQVDSDPALTFTTGNGITTVGQTLVLSKLAGVMTTPTGCYRYDLVEIETDKANNIFHGWFVVEPSVTAL